MLGTKSLPSTLFDHRVWCIQATDGSWRRAEIELGECLLLFTSLDSLHAYIDGCEDRREANLTALLFSTTRKEFGRRAREAGKKGIVGALFDPEPETGEAPFLRFAKLGAA